MLLSFTEAVEQNLAVMDETARQRMQALVIDKRDMGTLDATVADSKMHATVRGRAPQLVEAQLLRP